MIWKFVILLVVLIFYSTHNIGSGHIMEHELYNSQHKISEMLLFLCGDVMTGRGIDQILPHSVDPGIYESYVKDARIYVKLAEKVNGPVNQPVSYDYIWGDALKVWEHFTPDLKIINLETSITDHNDPWKGKGINYRMHPENVQVLIEAGIDFCSLANNHIIDWERAGLAETLKVLNQAGITHAGAGLNLAEAKKPAVLKTKKGRIIIFSYGSTTSGIPVSWAATENESGINLLPDLSELIVNTINDQVKQIKKENDIVIFSVHWGGNWGYEIPGYQRSLSHRLINEADVDVIHGHSSHHPRAIEVYKDKLILYGAGDFINDYEGISGYEEFRDDLSLMYFPAIDPVSGDLLSMKLVPMQIKNIRLNDVSSSDAVWMQNLLNREGKKFGTSFKLNEDGTLSMFW